MSYGTNLDNRAGVGPTSAPWRNIGPAGTEGTSMELPDQPIAPCGIAVMAKASAPGRTKTRLVPPLTLAEAAEFNTACLQDVAANLLAAKSSGVAGYMAYGPPGHEGFFTEMLPAGIGLFPCWHGDFGICLREAAAELFGRGHNSACLLNADSPNLPTAYLAETAEALARPGDRIVLGPALDGGYYIIGMKHLHWRLFEEIAWSTDRVAAETLERAQELGLEVHLLPSWYDVDDAASIDRLRRDLASGPPDEARHARAFLTRLDTTPSPRPAGRPGIAAQDRATA